MNKEEISASYVMVPRELLERATEALESEVDARYGKPVHPALERKYKSDMVEVKEIRKLLAGARPMSNEESEAN